MQLRNELVEQSQSGTGLRVTPEEFARAVASVEARNSAAERGDGRISLDQAVRELSSHVSTDEVAAEVAANRQRSAQSLEARTARRSRLRARFTRALLIASLALNGLLTYRLSIPRDATFTQVGNVHIVAGKSGYVRFPLPYARPPSVTVDTFSPSKTVITDITGDGFQWSNSGPDDAVNNGNPSWTAVGQR